MRTDRFLLVFFLTLLPVLFLGCASTTAPRGWLPSARETQKQAYGAWISVEYDTCAGCPDRIDGEFIGVSSDSIFVLSKDGLTPVPTEQIKRAKLATYDAEHWILELWTVGGSLSTVSHGAFLLFSFPVWVISGSIATASQSRAPIEKYPRKPWEELRIYARFPQGLPKGFTEASLKE